MSKLRRAFVVSAACLGLAVSGAVAANAAPVDAPPVETTQAPVSGQQADPQNDNKLSAAAAVCEFPVSVTNAGSQDKTTTSATPRFYSSTLWTNLECGSLTVTVPAGRQAGIVVRTDAELTCTGPAPDTTEWCQGRVLINGITEMFPRVTEGDGSFAWAQSSSDVGAWESNSFTRSLQVRCPPTTTTPTCSYRVQVQVRNHAAGYNFRVDDSTVEAQLTYQ